MWVNVLDRQLKTAFIYNNTHTHTHKRSGSLWRFCLECCECCKLTKTVTECEAMSERASVCMGERERGLKVWKERTSVCAESVCLDLHTHLFAHVCEILLPVSTILHIFFIPSFCFPSPHSLLLYLLAAFLLWLLLSFLSQDHVKQFKALLSKKKEVRISIKVSNWISLSCPLRNDSFFQHLKL